MPYYDSNVRNDGQDDRVVKACVAACLTACLTGGAVGLDAAAGATGAAIMHSAGWTAGGVPVVTVGKTAAAAAAGSASLYFLPFLCGVTADVYRRYNLSEGKKIAAMCGGVIFTGGLAGVVGAAEMGLKGAPLGYVAASTAAGALIIPVAYACVCSPVGYCVGMFAEAAAKKKADSKNNAPTLDGQQYGRVVPYNAMH